MFSPSAIASMVSTIAGEFEAVAATVATELGAKPQLAAQIQAGIDGLKTTAAALAGAESGADGRALIDRIAADANAVLAALAMLPLPPQAAIVLRIAQVLVPTVLGVATIVWPAHPVASPAPTA
jgi:hypothetical protein